MKIYGHNHHILSLTILIVSSTKKDIMFNILTTRFPVAFSKCLSQKGQAYFILKNFHESPDLEKDLLGLM